MHPMSVEGVCGEKKQITNKEDRNNGLSKILAYGGGSGIRTLGTLSRPTVFKTAAFDHSAKPPVRHD